MRISSLIPSLMTLFLAATPSFAQWQTVQSDAQAQATYQDGKYELWISCRRCREFELSLMDPTLRGNEFSGVQSLMMWVTLPDGRTDRWPVSIAQEDPLLSGDLFVSEVNLDFFRNTRSFELDSPQTREKFLSGDMKATGAARLAFLEQCGL